jgi:hypothetical protein
MAFSRGGGGARWAGSGRSHILQHPRVPPPRPPTRAPPTHTRFQPCGLSASASAATVAAAVGPAPIRRVARYRTSSVRSVAAMRASSRTTVREHASGSATVPQRHCQELAHRCITYCAVLACRSVQQCCADACALAASVIGTSPCACRRRHQHVIRRPGHVRGSYEAHPRCRPVSSFDGAASNQWFRDAARGHPCAFRHSRR